VKFEIQRNSGSCQLGEAAAQAHSTLTRPNCALLPRPEAPFAAINLRPWRVKNLGRDFKQHPTGCAQPHTATYLSFSNFATSPSSLENGAAGRVRSRQGRPSIAQRFIAGNAIEPGPSPGRDAGIAAGTPTQPSVLLSSLPGLAARGRHAPAMNRWAIVGRPLGWRPRLIHSKQRRASTKSVFCLKRQPSLAVCGGAASGLLAAKPGGFAAGRNRLPPAESSPIKAIQGGSSLRRPRAVQSRCQFLLSPLLSAAGVHSVIRPTGV
jgi:hypothetical protein